MNTVDTFVHIRQKPAEAGFSSLSLYSPDFNDSAAYNYYLYIILLFYYFSD